MNPNQTRTEAKCVCGLQFVAAHDRPDVAQGIIEHLLGAHQSQCATQKARDALLEAGRFDLVPA